MATFPDGSIAALNANPKKVVKMTSYYCLDDGLSWNLTLFVIFFEELSLERFSGRRYSFYKLSLGGMLLSVQNLEAFK
jgi:hypothetical protein